MIKKSLSIVLLLPSLFVFADVNDEIEHLLNFVGKTECTYQRNGNGYSGREAREHIQKKYAYYRDDIKTAEDFITYSATKSTMSGKKYTINCIGEKVQFSGEWLNSELKAYRAQLLEK
jgi:hypothetical protein